jgi:hypothetical protein
MSGGHFDYISFKFDEFSTNLKMEIDTNGIPDGDGDVIYDYSPEVITRLELLVTLTDLVSTLSHSVEWLYSGDIGEDTFTARYDKATQACTNEQLSKLLSKLL